MLFNFTFQSGYIPITNRLRVYPLRLCPLHSNLVIFQFHPGINPELFLAFTFQSGYIPISKDFEVLLFAYTLHSNLVIFQLFSSSASSPFFGLYIPIWLYSNPSTIIPHIYRLWKLLFVDLRFLIHPTAIFFASYSYYLCLDLYYSGFVYLPIFKVYHRLTIILVQLMFYINLV